MTDNPYLTPRQSAALLGVQVGAVRVYWRRGLIHRSPPETWYNEQHPLYTRESVEAYLASRDTAPTP